MGNIRSLAKFALTIFIAFIAMPVAGQQKNSVSENYEYLNYSKQYNYNTRRYEATISGLRSRYYNIDEIVIPDCFPDGSVVVAINDAAFSTYTVTGGTGETYNSRLKRVIFENKEQLNWGSKLFKNCKTLEYVDFGTNTIIPENAFEGCTGLKKLSLNNAIKRIGENAFKGCTSLERLTDCSKVEYIRANAFEGCRNLSEISIMPSLKEIGDSAFRYCRQFLGFRTSEKNDSWSVTKIGKEAFLGCSQLSFLPKFSIVVHIDDKAFYGCDRLTEVDCAPSHIGVAAFAKCQNLLSIKSSKSSVTNNMEISPMAFIDCQELKQIGPFESIVQVGASAFKNCTSLETPEFKCNPTGGSVFANCTNLKSVSLECTTIPDSLFYDCHSLKIVIPTSVERIGNYAFANCFSTTEFLLPESLFSLADGVFLGNMMNQITIPKQVQYIGSKTFGNCSNLSKVTSLNPIPPKCDIDAFEGVIVKQCSLNVDDSCIKKYVMAPVWKDFNIQFVKMQSIEIVPQSPIFDYKGKYYIFEYSSAVLNLYVKPSNALFQSALWTLSSDKVYVDGYFGHQQVNDKERVIIKTQSYGMFDERKPVTITAQSLDGSNLEDKLELNLVAPTHIVELSSTSTYLEIGEKLKLTSTITPVDAIQEVEWSSSDDNIATVINGEVYGKAKGSAVITARSVDGTNITATCEVTVGSFIKEIKIPSSIELKEQSSVVLTAEIIPETTDNMVLRWISDNENVATVTQDGEVKAISQGTATITVRSTDGPWVTADCEVRVTKPVAEINLSETSLTLNEGKAVKLMTEIIPETADNKVLKWESSDETVATVSQYGIVKAISKGTTIVTASSTDGSEVTAICEVYVIRPVTEIKLSETSMTLKEGEAATLTAEILPETADNKELEWVSSDESVVTVTQNGEVKAISQGTATITVSSTNNSDVTATCEVRVIRPVAEIKLSETSVILKRGEHTHLSAKIIPETADNKELKWECSDENVATVTQYGFVEAISQGIATIFVSSTDGSQIVTTCEVRVINPVTEIKLSETSMTLNEGEAATLTTEVLPETADNKVLKWTSSDENVATVTQNGEVKAISQGTAIIIAEATDGSGVKAECKVEVKENSGITSVGDDTSEILVENGIIIIKNVGKGAHLNLIQMDGIQLYHTISNGNDVYLNVPTAGVYIVVIGNKAHKITVF